MTGWQRLSVRRGIRSRDEPYEGVPGHLKHPLSEWVLDLFGWNSSYMDDELMALIASTLRIPLSGGYGPINDQIFAALNSDDDLYLDCIDACLHLSANPQSEKLKRILETGGSVWTVNSAGDGLERRVDATTKEASVRAMSAGDAASEELAAAWAAVYGRNPNPSDGWDHSIKAVEEILIPLVVPNQQKANLGHVAGQLKSDPSKWSFQLDANDVRTNGETLEGMIRHIWPNPDRHGGAQKRTPTQGEVEAVVQLAIAIVELCRRKLVKVP